MAWSGADEAMLTADGARRAFVALLGELHFAERYYGWFEQHRAEPRDDDADLEVHDALEASPLPFKLDKRERFLGARYRRDAIGVTLNVIPRGGQIEIVSSFQLSKDLRLGGTWHGLALEVLRLDDPYAIYNPPYPRLQCNASQARDAVALILAIHAETEHELLRATIFTDPAAQDPPLVPLTHAIVDERALADTFHDVLEGVGLRRRAVALRERCRPFRGAPLVHADQAEQLLAKRAIPYVRTDGKRSTRFEVRDTVGAMRWSWVLTVSATHLDFGILATVYPSSGVGGSLAYLVDALSLRAGEPKPGESGDSWLHAATTAQLEELLDEALALIADARAALERSPIPRFSAPGRHSGAWPPRRPG